ncbi:MAG: hypothetical protein ACREGG_04075 [Candidatus Saccharimonadales bacterium]
MAPSVHNTQPWKVTTEGNKLIILPDESRALTHGDPTGRQTYISRGIFTEACIIGLNQVGLTCAEPRLENDNIILETQRGGAKNPTDTQALNSRFTDRTTYKKAVISAETIARLDSSWHSENVEVVTTDKPELIKETARLTSQALLLAFSNPAFREELTDFFVDMPSTSYGIPLSTLGMGKVKAKLVKHLVRSGINRKQESQTEYKRWLSASGLVFILASGDSRPYWLESGRAYLRASLEIQKLGLNQATSAAIVEAADFHEDIERLLGTDKRIESVIRIGRGQKKKAVSGRFSSQELLVT